MKTKLHYVPFKITIALAYRQTITDQDEEVPIPPGPGVESVAASIYHGIRKWRRFPVAFGDTDSPDAGSVFVLLDGIETPFALLDSKHSTVAKAERCKPHDLPKSLRELFNHLVALGHARDDTRVD